MFLIQTIVTFLSGFVFPHGFPDERGHLELDGVGLHEGGYSVPEELVHPSWLDFVGKRVQGLILEASFSFSVGPSYQ